MTPKPADGVITFKFRGGEPATVILDEESGWRSEDAPELADLCAAVAPWPPPDISTPGYDPNPLLTTLKRAADILEGTITQEPKVKRIEGVIY